MTAMGNAIAKKFEEYVVLTQDKVKTICKEVADDVKEEIKHHAPVDTGRYKRSWEITEDRRSSKGVKYTVHAGQYRLTHLLEYGHAKRGGGRTRAFPHISKGENLAIRELKQKAGAL